MVSGNLPAPIPSRITAGARPNDEHSSPCNHTEPAPIPGTGFVRVAHPNDPDLETITMKQSLVKATELGSPKCRCRSIRLYAASKH
jgi:hypothetical protein